MCALPVPLCHFHTFSSFQLRRKVVSPHECFGFHGSLFHGPLPLGMPVMFVVDFRKLWGFHEL